MQAESLAVLEKANVAPAQAGAIARAIEIEIGGVKSTRDDLLAQRQDFHASHAELRTEIAKLAAELHTEIHRAVSGLTRQMYMALLGHLAMTLVFVCFLVATLR
jgi:hypothetical protein